MFHHVSPTSAKDPESSSPLLDHTLKFLVNKLKDEIDACMKIFKVEIHEIMMGDQPEEVKELRLQESRKRMQEGMAATQKLHSERTESMLDLIGSEFALRAARRAKGSGKKMKLTTTEERIEAIQRKDREDTGKCSASLSDSVGQDRGESSTAPDKHDEGEHSASLSGFMDVDP
ncbi:hypothetical protein MMC28_007465 [Mycoblastus sanguinarius]|nr:hypothetical protein [Mycoblastus sanguinarius]